MEGGCVAQPTPGSHAQDTLPHPHLMAPPPTHQTQFQITDKMTRDVNHTAGHREDKRSLNRKDDFKKIKIVRHLFTSIERTSNRHEVLR